MRLDEITVSQFVDILCGDRSAIKEAHPKMMEAEIETNVRELIVAYKEMADPSGLKSYLNRSSRLAKARAQVAVFTVCKALVELGEIEKVKDTISPLCPKAPSMGEERLKAEVASRLEHARNEIRRIEEDSEDGNGKTEDVRRAFDAQTAALMAHFKFQIDPSKMKASLYANLVARHAREIKAQMAAMRKK